MYSPHVIVGFESQGQNTGIYVRNIIFVYSLPGKQWYDNHRFIMVFNISLWCPKCPLSQIKAPQCFYIRASGGAGVGGMRCACVPGLDFRPDVDYRPAHSNVVQTDLFQRIQE